MNIVAKAENGKARIIIKGEISEWKNSAEEFTRQVDELVSSGIRDADLYIHSPGGGCVEANEIVNVIRRFPGSISGVGGALVASAASYIAVNCDTFSMPENGLLMFHKPRGGVFGTADDVRSYLKMMEATENNYYEAFTKKCNDKSTFKKEWDKGDYWLSATEAKAQGFVNTITEKCPADKETARMITACGYTGNLSSLGYLPEIKPTNNQNPISDMNLANIAPQLGISADMDESAFVSTVMNWKKGAERTTQLEAELKSIREKEINTLLDKAILEKRITADTKQGWYETLTDHFERGKKLLEALSPVSKPETITPPLGGSPAGGKKLEDLSAKEREYLFKSDPAAYEKLVSEHAANN